MDIILFLPILISFLVTLFILPKWIKKAKKIGLVWEDMNKPKNTRKVAGSGGLVVVFGFVLGVLFYIFLKTFYFKDPIKVVEIFALTTSTLILAGIGLIDDLFGWWHGGLSKKFRLLLCLVAAVPLIVINAGDSTINIPFVDGTNFGWIYPLLIIPLGIVGASTTFNFLAGFNGLEAGNGVIILTALSFVAYFSKNSWLGLIGLCMAAGLLAFLYFNRFPARVFPGDVLTYSVGGVIAIMAILGNMERIAIFFFVPYILEVVLKSRGKLGKPSFGKPNEDGSLEIPYNKIYGLTHFSVFILKKFKNKVCERDVVHFIYAIQVSIVIIGFVVFRNSIFKL